MVGDGYSDVCPARAADQVFAKPILHEKCLKNGTPSLLYDDFGDILRCLEKSLVINHFGDEAMKVFDVLGGPWPYLDYRPLAKGEPSVEALFTGTCVVSRRHQMNLVYSNDKSLYMLDLNGTMAGMLKMLQRLIGEDINLAWLPGVDVWIVKIDPSRIDQLLANLCINARHAIAGVGKLTIDTGTSTSTRTIAPITRALFPGSLSCSL